MAREGKVRVDVWVPVEDVVLWRRRAERRGVSLSEWVRLVLLVAAREAERREKQDG